MRMGCIVRASNFDSVTRYIGLCVVVSVPASTFRGGVHITVSLLLEVDAI